MPNIKEIALKVADSLRNKIDGISHMQSNQGLVAFAEALIAELAKGNEPCAFLHEWIEYHPFGDTYAGKRCAAITSDGKPFDSSDTVSPLFTFPPTAEQIANETAWQPLESAPKDGRELILLLTPSNWPQVAYSNTWWQGGFSVENKPTHWMPLPTPPKRSMEGV